MAKWNISFWHSILLITFQMFSSSKSATFLHLDNYTDVNMSHQSEQYCTYRYFDPYPIYLFKLVSSWSCYNYAHPKWMQGGQIWKTHYGIIHNLTQYKIPCIMVDNQVILFDYDSEYYLNLIKNLHVNEKYYHKWLNCSMAAMDCCVNYLTASANVPDKNFPCTAIWDGYTCYERTEANTFVYKLCPTYLTSSDKFICNLESVKHCNSNGWSSQTDYARCSSSFKYRHRHTYHIIILYVALAFMAPSIPIFFCYHQLKKWRIILHRNLIVAIFIKNILVVLSKNIIILNAINVQQDESVMENDSLWCRTLTIFENFSKNLIFTCMTADAYHSHKTIARAFSPLSDFNLWYFIIIVASSIPTIVWSILIAVSEAGQCWVSDLAGYQWITDSYKYACLIINCVLLIDIMRVLFVNLIKRTGKHTGRTIKATVILSFLFGVPLLLSSQRSLVRMDNCLEGDIYIYCTYSIEGLQGIFMALFFCYMNQEVLQELKRSWKHKKQAISEYFSCWKDTIKRRTTIRTTTNEVFV